MNKTQKVVSLALLTVLAHAFAADQLQVVTRKGPYDLTKFNFADCKTGKDCSAYVAAQVVKQDQEKFAQERELAFANANNRSFVVRPFAKGYLYTGIGLSGLYHGLGVTASYGWNILKYPLTALGIVTAANYFFEDKIAQVVDSPEKLMAGAVAAGGLVGLVCGPRDVAKNNRLAEANTYKEATGELLHRSFQVSSSLNALQQQAEQAADENKRQQDLICASIEQLKEKSNELNGRVTSLGKQAEELKQQTGELKEDGQVAMSVAFDNIYKQSLQTRISLMGLITSVICLPEGDNKSALLDQCFGLVKEFMHVYEADKATIANLCKKYPAFKNSNYSDSIDGFDNSVKEMSAYLSGSKVPAILSERFKQFRKQQLALAAAPASSIVEIVEVKSQASPSNYSAGMLSMFNNFGRTIVGSQVVKPRRSEVITTELENAVVDTDDLDTISTQDGSGGNN